MDRYFKSGFFGISAAFALIACASYAAEMKTLLHDSVRIVFVGDSIKSREQAVAIDSLLELSPQIGQKVRGETTQRLYWSNKATDLMNDVPGEAQLTPGAWERWEFVLSTIK